MIRVYDRGQHPAGFIGVRVAVYVDGKLRQKYFSRRKHLINDALAKAEKLEQWWLAQQAEFKKRRLKPEPYRGYRKYHREWQRQNRVLHSR